MANVAKIVNNGLALISGRLKGTGAEPKFVGWGTGTTAAAITDTGLQTPAAEDRGDGTTSQATTTVTNDTYRIAATIYCSGSAKAITEMAIFNAATSGDCLGRATFDPINVEVGEGIAFTADVQFAQPA